MPTPAELPRLHAGSMLFDVCHGGVLLRALLCVHGVVGLALAWQSRGAQAWLDQASLVVVVVLPATVLWLFVACLTQRRLGGWPRLGYWGAGVGLGASCGLLAGAAWRGLALALGNADASADAARWVTGGGAGWMMGCGALTGAAFAAAMLHWLEQRERLRQPVDARARLAELQARIRPHFLFNALNSAVALVQVDPAKAESVLEDLSDLFRAALAEDRGEVSLGEELALARRYLSIEQVRFGERLALHWALDLAADAARLPPLVLQPLVENAVRHGVEPSADGAALTVTTTVQRGQAIVRIANSVPPVRRPARNPAGQGMALRNVRERLYLMHDVRLQFDAGLDEAGHWVVRIAVPLPDDEA
jgi:two-component system sensor histidine kinase AlgZ